MFIFQARQVKYLSAAKKILSFSLPFSIVRRTTKETAFERTFYDAKKKLKLAN